MFITASNFNTKMCLFFKQFIGRASVLPQFKPIERITQQGGQSRRGTLINTAAPESPSPSARLLVTWSIGLYYKEKVAYKSETGLAASVLVRLVSKTSNCACKSRFLLGAEATSISAWLGVE